MKGAMGGRVGLRWKLYRWFNFNSGLNSKKCVVQRVLQLELKLKVLIDRNNTILTQPVRDAGKVQVGNVARVAILVFAMLENMSTHCVKEFFSILHLGESGAFTKY